MHPFLNKKIVSTHLFIYKNKAEGPPVLKSAEATSKAETDTRKSLDTMDVSVTQNLMREAKKCIEGKKEDVIHCLKTITADSGWRERNVAIVKALGFDVEGKSPNYIQKIIEGVQKTVFEALNLHDKRAKCDGKCGDYTTLALEIYYGIENNIDPSHLKNSDGLKDRLFFKEEEASVEKLPKDVFEGWESYKAACLAQGMSEPQIETDHGKFGKLWNNLRLNELTGNDFESWIDAIALSDLSDESVRQLTIGAQVLARREIFSGNLEDSEVFEVNAEKVYAAYKNLLGERMNRASFATFKDALMPTFAMKKVNDKEYLLGRLYVMVYNGELDRESWKKTLTDEELRISIANGQPEVLPKVA